MLFKLLLITSAPLRRRINPEQVKPGLFDEYILIATFVSFFLQLLYFKLLSLIIPSIHQSGIHCRLVYRHSAEIAII